MLSITRLQIKGAEMKIGKCEARVIPGVEMASGHVKMTHGTEYSVYVGNGFSEDADAEISVDGKLIGTWRIPAFLNVEIERPANSERKLTFYKSGTAESFHSGEISVNRDNMGLVSVKIIPERRREMMVGYSSMLGGAMRYGGGMSGLGRMSSQRFGIARKIDRDYLRAITINLRLVCDNSYPVPITDVRENPVPPPLED